MNLANKITITRMALIPLFMIAFMWNFPYNELVACVIFNVKKNIYFYCREDVLQKQVDYIKVLLLMKMDI